MIDDYSDAAMIAFLPYDAEWAKEVDNPHMTLVYAGETKDHPPTGFNELAKDAAMLAMFVKPFRLLVKANETFGDSSPVSVFTLQPTPDLWAMRRSVERWNKSEHEFRPHVTIGPPGTVIEHPPRAIGFDRLSVSWGKDQLVFWLRR